MLTLKECFIKRNPSHFLFIGNLAFLCFSARSHIFDLETEEFIDSVDVKYLSEVCLDSHQNKLFLKSIKGPVYAYEIESKKLSKIGSTSQWDNGIFLDSSGENLITFSQLGVIWKISTVDNLKEKIYRNPEKCFHQCGWDDPNDKCYKFLVSPGEKRLPSILKVSYTGELIQPGTPLEAIPPLLSKAKAAGFLKAGV